WRVLGSVVTAGLRKAADGDLAAACRQLGVDYLLDGSVRRAGASLRVSAQLVDIESGAVMWSGQFDRPLRELADLQEELVSELAGALATETHLAEIQHALKKPGDLTAWEAVTRSMGAVARGIDPMVLMQAVAEAQRAVDIAPDYPEGLGQLAAMSALAYFMMSPDDPSETQRIRALADKALVLGHAKANVLVNVGGALLYVGTPQEALAPLERAQR